MTTVPTTTAPDVRRAVRATYIVFIASGVGFSTWASRLPQVRDRLEVSPAELGLILLAIAAGSLLALPLSGIIVDHVGAARTVLVSSVVLAVSLTAASIGYLYGVLPVVIALFGVGFGMGAWDVAMNVHGAEAERRDGRSIMPRFHAGFSVGTVLGALVGATCVYFDIPVTAHLIGVAIVVVAVVPLTTRQFLPDPEKDPDVPHVSAFTAWKEPRTLLVGLFVLCFAFVEGTGNDWIAIAVIDGYRADAALGTLGFAVFLSAMTLGRWFGPALLDRYGRVPVVRATAVIGLVGLLMFVFGPWLPVAVAGMLLWGIGASLGFPVGMSAAGDDPTRGPARVSVVASIGYVAFLAGPPLVGFLGDHVGVLRALLATAGLLGLALLIAGCVKPLEKQAAVVGTPERQDEVTR